MSLTLSSASLLLAAEDEGFAPPTVEHSFFFDRLEDRTVISSVKAMILLGLGVILILVLFLAAAIILIHCYYGYTASGGPAGVGQAVGRAIRTSIVFTVVADFFLSFAIWGSTTTVRITG